MDISVWEAAGAPEEVPGLGAAAIKALGRFMAHDGRAARAGGPARGPRTRRGGGERPGPGAPRFPSPSCWRRCCRRRGYLEALEAERTIEAQGRIENLEQLVEVGREFDAAASEQSDTLETFLQEIALVADADSRSDEEGLVTLMTVHNAKGLEYPIVFIAGCEDGVFPHSRAIDEGELEEERRLFYVGVTRAMRELYLTYARRRAVFGAQTSGMRSRFLDEIPASCWTSLPSRRGGRSGRSVAGGFRAAVGAPGGSPMVALREASAGAFIAARTREAHGARRVPARRGRGARRVRRGGGHGRSSPTG